MAPRLLTEVPTDRPQLVRVDPKLAFLPEAQRNVVSSACELSRRRSDEAFDRCLGYQLSLNRGDEPRSEVARFSKAEREAIEQACFVERYSGPQIYEACLRTAVRDRKGQPDSMARNAGL